MLELRGTEPDAARTRAWAAARAGRCVVVGGRVAVWAPVPDLAAIIVLDEGDEALQEERTPTWNGRDVAVERAARAGAALTLVAAAPTLEAEAIAGPPQRPDRGTERRTPGSSEGGSERPAPKLRSENGFGSSSKVPGAETPPATDDRGGSDEPREGEEKDDSPGEELRAQRPPPAAAAPAEPLRVQQTATSDGEPSAVRVFLLLGLALVIGAGVGLATRAARRRSSG